MTQQLGTRPRPARSVLLYNARYPIVIVVILLTLILAGLMAGQPQTEPEPGIGVYSPFIGVGVCLFAVLFAILTLLAYRMQPGVYTGFQHSAVVAAYLTLGPVATVGTTVLGTILAELGRFAFGRRLDLRPHTVRQTLETTSWSVGVHACSTLLAGVVFMLLGGTLPLMTGKPGLISPVIGYLAVNLVLYGLALWLSRDWSGRTPAAPRSMIGLIAGEIFSLPLALLLPIAYYELPPLAFLMLITSAVMAALLFRVSEQSRSSLERRVEDLATLNSIGQAMASSLAMSDLLQSIYDQVAALIDVPYFYIALYASDTQTISFPFAVRDGKKVALEPYQSVNGAVDHIVGTREPLLLRGSVNNELLKLGIQPSGPDSACYLAVPLVADDEVIGVLAVQSFTRADAYSQSDVAVLAAVAAQAAIALHNAGLYNRVWEMADELALLNNVSSVVTATLDLDIVLDTTCAVVIQIGHADKTAIFLTSEDGQTLRLVHAIGLSDDYVAQFQSIRRDDNSGPTDIMNQHEAVAIPDVWTDPRGLGWRSLAEVEGYVGLLTVPLITSNQVIGFLASYYQQPHLFGKSELDLMTTLANQVAVTVANARLYADAQTRAQDMTQLVEASRAFTASLDLKSVADKVLNELSGILDPEMAALMLIGPDGQLRPPVAQRGAASLGSLPSVGSIARAIVTNKALTLPDHNDDVSVLQQLGLQSLYVIPVVGQERVIGVALIGHKALHLISPRERQLAEALVNQASIAIRNAQLYGQTDAALADRVSELSAIEEISRKISGRLDLAAIINDVLDTALEVTQADLAGCGLIVSQELVTYSERYPAESQRGPVQHILKRGEGIMGRVLRTGTSALVGDVPKDADFRQGTLPVILSELCVPITYKEERVGFLNLDSRSLDAFTESHLRFLGNLADHAAIAIENARLFEERQIQIDTLTKLRDLSLGLLSATSLPAVMKIITQYALEIAHAKDVHLYLYDGALDVLTFGASLWLDGRENVEASRPDRGGSTYQVARTGDHQFIEDISQVQPAHQFERGPGFGAIARIALKRGGRVLGVLIIAYREAHFFTESESRALDLLANQSAIAVENARLFDEVRAGRDQMQVILDSARDGMILIGANGELMLANPAAEQMFGHSLRPFLGQHMLRVIAQIHRTVGASAEPSSYEMIHKLLHNVGSAPDDVARATFQMITPAGIQDIEGTILPVRGDDGGIGGRLVVLRDVSEEKSIERFRWDATNMIVHDLRAPLGGVISSLRLIEEMVAEQDFADLDQVVTIAVNSSENQMHMIESILEIAKLETGQMPLNIHTWPLNPLVHKAIAAIEVVANTANVRVKDCVPKQLPPVRMDEDQIRRVVINLLDNALRHTPAEGEVRVEAALTPAKDFARIGVVDTGKGIPLEARERIFEKFYQVSQSALRGHRGVGLGLTFCRLSVEAHGGRIWVEDGPEGGAAFWFTLPVVNGDQLKPGANGH